jgi:uncharacterized protein
MKHSILAPVAAASSGIIFGMGLAISRMIDPQKIQNFLDVAAIPSGGWDPSLAFVLFGAILVAFFGMRLDRMMSAPLAAKSFGRQDRFELDRPLIIGAAIFGIGWGMAGLCPGPAISGLGLIPESIAVFVVTMLVGSWVTGHLLERASNREATLQTASATSK